MKVLVLLSGGIDSSTCLGHAIEKHGKEDVVALTLMYGQKHSKEIESARSLAKHYDVEHIEMDLSPIFQYSNCSLLSHSTDAVPEESYAEQLKKQNGEPVTTYVPFRNGLFISTATSVALSKGCDVILYGAHADDSAGNAYPDCSVEFTEAMNNAVILGSGNKVRLYGPFVKMNKAEVVKRGLNIGVPYKKTWSCYEGGDKPCGKCGTCIDRIEAFKINGAVDPLMED